MSALAELTVQLELQSAAFQRGMDQANRAMQRMEQQGKQLNSAMSSIASTLTSVGRQAAAAVGAFGAFETITGVVSAGEKVRNLKASLEALTGSTTSADDMLSKIRQTANDLGAPILDVGEAAQKLTIALKDIGGTNTDIDKIIRSFSMLGRIGGTDMPSVNEALRQFSQAAGKGKLNGDEFNTIAERMPLILKTVADSLGVTQGELRKMASEGELTGAKVALALINAAPRIEAEYAKLPNTVGQSLNRLKNTAFQIGADIEKALSLSAISTDGINSFNAALVNIKQAVTDVSAAWNTLSFDTKIGAASVAVGALAIAFNATLIPAIGAATTAIAALGAAMLTTPLGWISILAGGALLVAANWEKATAIWKETFPIVMASLESAYNQTMLALVKGANDTVASIVRFFRDGINIIIDKLNELGAALGKVGAGFNIARITGDIQILSDAQEEFQRRVEASAQKEIEARAKVKAMMEDEAAFKREMAKQDAIDRQNAQSYQSGINPAAGLTEKLAAGGKAVDDFASKFQGLMDKLFPAEKAARDMQAAIELLNQAMANGQITPEKYAEAIKKIPEAFSGKGGVQDTLKDILDQMNSFTKQFVDSVVDGIFSGKFKLEDLLKDMAKSITKWLLNRQIQQFFKMMEGFGQGGSGGGFMGWLGGLFGGGAAHGAAFNKGVQMFANGGVVGSPTMFGMAGNRFGVMGEAGPEAIIPLRRSASGDLGVKSSPVVVNVINQAGVEIETTEKEQPNGMKEITMMIRREVSKGINDGTFDRQFRTAFGVVRQGY